LHFSISDFFSCAAAPTYACRFARSIARTFGRSISTDKKMKRWFNSERKSLVRGSSGARSETGGPPSLCAQCRLEVAICG
jgi:hypothetical protein